MTRAVAILDELMPTFDVAARYEIVVHATPEQVWKAIEAFDFSQARVARILLWLRTLGCAESESITNLSREERMRQAGFIPLRKIDNVESVVGIVGRFWRPTGNVRLGLSAEQVIAFEEPGFAKALWNMRVEASDGGSTLSTETRIACIGAGARRKFKAYWTLVGPFSGLIRKEILRMIKTQTETGASEKTTPASGA